MNDISTKLRTESDSMGPVQMPADKLWGAQTQRSLENFCIGTEHLPRALIRSLGIVKLCAAKVNMKLGLLDEQIGKTICAGAREVIDG